MNLHMTAFRESVDEALVERALAMLERLVEARALSEARASNMVPAIKYSARMRGR